MMTSKKYLQKSEQVERSREMQEFTNTAKDELNTDEDKKCVYYNECYLQVRNGGICDFGCKDRVTRTGGKE